MLRCRLNSLVPQRFLRLVDAALSRQLSADEAAEIVRFDVFQLDRLSVALHDAPGASAAKGLGRGLRSATPAVKPRENQPVGRDRPSR
jgi:hypothetical protein